MKKNIAAVLVLTLTLALTGAGAGTASDPLITKSYAEDTYKSSLVTSLGQSVDSVLRSAYDKAAAPLTGSAQPSDLHYTTGVQAFALQTGGTVTLKAGTSITVTGGSVTFSAGTGALLDATTGETASSGALALRHRYICLEDTSALCTAADPVLFQLEGAYGPGNTMVRQYAVYSDVAGSEWYTDAAVYIRERQLFHDYSAAKFRPNEATTRADMVYALWVQAGSPDTTYNGGFVDLTEDWYTQAVNWAAEKGITNGQDPTHFNPSGGVSRAEMVTFLYRSTAVRGGRTDQRADLTAFEDSPLLDTDRWSWAKDTVSWAVASGIIQGMTPTTLVPQDSSTRAQVATILMRQGM